MSEKNRFKFVNDQESSIEEDNEIELIENEDVDIIEGSSRKAAKIRYLKSAVLMLVISLMLVAFGLFWQAEFSLMAVGDALWLAFALEFFAGWVLFVYNHNILSPLLYGSKSFVLMFLGKRPKTDYYSYMKNIQDNTISSYYYIVIFISAFILLVPAVITLLILT